MKEQRTGPGRVRYPDSFFVNANGLGGKAHVSNDEWGGTDLESEVEERLLEAMGDVAVTRRMLGMNFTSDQISQATGLSLDEVEALRAGTGN